MLSAFNHLVQCLVFWVLALTVTILSVVITVIGVSPVVLAAALDAVIVVVV